MAQLLGLDEGARDAAPTIARKPQARDFGEEVGGSAAMGWRPDLQDEIQNAEKPQAGRHGGWKYQETCFKILPAESVALPHRTVLALGEGSPYCPALVVPVPLANERPPSQSVSGMEDVVGDSVGRGAEGDWEVEEPVEDPGPSGG